MPKGMPAARTRGDGTDAGEWRVWQPEPDTAEADGEGDAAAVSAPVGDTPRREAKDDSGDAVDPDQTDTQPLFPHPRRGGGSPLD